MEPGSRRSRGHQSCLGRVLLVRRRSIGCRDNGHRNRRRGHLHAWQQRRPIPSTLSQRGSTTPVTQRQAQGRMSQRAPVPQLPPCTRDHRDMENRLQPEPPHTSLDGLTSNEFVTRSGMDDNVNRASLRGTFGGARQVGLPETRSAAKEPVATTADHGLPTVE